MIQQIHLFFHARLDEMIDSPNPSACHKNMVTGESPVIFSPEIPVEKIMTLPAEYVIMSHQPMNYPSNDPLYLDED